ncbi:MAG: fructosamine kinase family protein [Anaerolineales bacterium]
MEPLPREVVDWLASSGEGELLTSKPVGGGCIHQARLLRTSAGGHFFLKSNRSVPQDMFRREAEGLQAIKVVGGPRIPEALLVGKDFLLLEDLQPAARRDDFWEVYGTQLACLHQQSNHQFGFPHDNYLGSSIQHNGWLEDGFDFYCQRRLVPQIQRAADQGYLTREDRKRCDSLLARLPDLLPGGPAVLVHGDLWSGNLITDSEGDPALIDPAAHYGWAEADLAMTDLFGRYPEDFYQAYLAENPLPGGFRERYPLYNLYHLLNHLNIFGRQYLPGVRDVLQRYS